MSMEQDIRLQGEAFRHLVALEPVWVRELAGALGHGHWNRLVLTGMGSSYFAALGASYVLASLGLPVVVELSSNLLYYDRGRLSPGDLVVAVSQSGESAEVVKLASELAARKVTVVAVTNTSDSTLAATARAALVTGVVPDHGVAIKTYGASMLALLYLGIHLTGQPTALWRGWVEQTAGAVEAANQQGPWWRDRGHALRDVRAAVVLGRGESLSAAWAGALLFNEVAKMPAWAEDGGEFRHGVIEVAEPGFLAAVVLPESAPAFDLGRAMVSELIATHATVIAVAPVSVTPSLAATGAQVLPVPAVDEAVLPLVQVVPFQWMSLGWAEARGFVPGEFRHTPSVIRTET